MKYKLDGQWYDISLPSYDATPIGTILPYAGTILPKDYLWCDGNQYLKTEKNELYNKIGDAYNLSTDTDNTKFRVPNIKGRVLVGLDSTQTEFDTLGETGGEKTHTLTIDEMPSHNHSTPYMLEGVSHSGSGNNIVGKQNTGDNWTTWGSFKGGNQAHNNLQPYIVVNYIIKAHPSAVNTSEVVNEHSTSETDVYSANYVNNNFQLEGEVLYSNDTGTTGNVTLSKNVSNYSYLEIFYTSSGYISSKKIDLSLSNTFILNLPFIYDDAYYDRMSKYSVANNTITFDSNLTINSNFSSVHSGVAEITIKKVIGYK